MQESAHQLSADRTWFGDMTFVAPAWANSDVITEVKLDQMVANDVHVREEVNYYPILTVALRFIQGDSLGYDTDTVITVDEITALGTYTTTATEQREQTADVNITGLSDGLHEIHISHGSNYNGDRAFPFIKTPDMDYLTCFVHHELDNEADEIDDPVNIQVTVIGHNVTKSWTW